MTGKDRRRAIEMSIQGFLMLVLMTFVLLASLVLLGDGSFAWFSRNTKNSVRGMQTKVDSIEILVKYYKSTDGVDFVALTSPEDLFADMMPGDCVWVRADYTSYADTDATLAVRLEPTEDGDTPFVLDGRYYYLATQLKIEETDEFILTPPGDRIAYDAPVAVPVTELGEVTVPAGGEASFLFCVTFVNYPDADQSAYQGTVGCYRTVVSEISE